MTQVAFMGSGIGLFVHGLRLKTVIFWAAVLSTAAVVTAIRAGRDG